MRQKIAIIHITGAPVIENERLSFTEGGSVHALFVAINLARSYDVAVICPNSPGVHQKHTLEYKGVKVICLGNSRWVRWSKIGDLSFFRETYKYIRQEKPDILIANNFLISALITLVPQKAITTTKIGVIHHLYRTQDVNGSSRRAVRSIGLLEKLALHILKLNKIGVINPEVKKTFIQEGFPENRIVVVGNGVDIENYQFSQNKLQHSLIYIGRLAELKGVTSLIDIIPQIKISFPDVMLHIIGDGPKHKEIIQRINQLSVFDNVTMHGYLTEGEKIKLLEKCAIYISNSQMEGFGLPLVEAMATGTVPIVKNIYAHRFVFQNEPVGYLVNNNKEMITKITELFSDEPKHLQLAKNGRDLVERQWTWTKVSEKYEELIRIPSNA